jgi:predicted nucleic acid-binding Zn ribbon protein
MEDIRRATDRVIAFLLALMGICSTILVWMWLWVLQLHE